MNSQWLLEKQSQLQVVLVSELSLICHLNVCEFMPSLLSSCNLFCMWTDMILLAFQPVQGTYKPLCFKWEIVHVKLVLLSLLFVALLKVILPWLLNVVQCLKRYIRALFLGVPRSYFHMLELVLMDRYLFLWLKGHILKETLNRFSLVLLLGAAGYTF